MVLMYSKGVLCSRCERGQTSMVGLMYSNWVLCSRCERGHTLHGTDVQ